MADKDDNETHELEAGWIRELAGILDETGLTEIEIEKNAVRLRVARSVASAQVVQAAPVQAPAVEASPAPEPAPAAAPTQSHPGAVPSPMVGTAYLSPSPGADPFVKEGASVSEGQTVMIIEAMKTMNPIAAPRSGTVSKILVSDAQPVEFNEPLLIIE